MSWRVARYAMTLGAFSVAFGAPRESGSGGFSWVPVALAQDAGELSAARKLFSEALADQAAQHYAVALEKFQKVQAVRDTQAVRYRVATCLEALGKLRAALEAYTAASVATGTDAESANIARVSRDKMDALTGRVARVVVKLPAQKPDDARVMIDNEVVQPNAMGTPIVIDPGVHEITATGTGATPFHAQATLVEGGTATIDVVLEVPRHAPPLPPMDTLPAAAPVATPPPPAPVPAAPAKEHASNGSGRKTAGIVTVSAGGALIVASVVLLVKQHADINTINACLPACPSTRRDELESTHSRALWEGPVGVGVGIAGIVSAGIGAYLLATPSKGHTGASSSFVPWVDPTTRGVAWSATF